MSPLQFADGTPFATGTAACACHPVHPGESFARLFVAVGIGTGQDLMGVVDTGGAFLIVPPPLAMEHGLYPELSFETTAVVVRGWTVRGHVHLVPFTFMATRGEHVTIDATAFVPDLEEGEEWPLPLYLGWQGCMDRLRFGVDPFTEQFYFGS